MKQLNTSYGVIALLLLPVIAVATPHSNLETELARLKNVVSTYMLEGVVEAELNTTISAQTAGVLLEVRFDVDDVVNKNEIVVVIDNKQQTSALRQTQAAEREAIARMQEALSEYDRAQKVYKDKVISKADFDRSRAGLEAARARVESAQAATAAAQEQLDYTLVRAPFSGILTKRLVEPGATVNVGTQLVSGVSLERLRVKTHVPQSIVRSVRQQKRVIVVTEDSEIVATDMTFFPFADVRSHSFELRINLPQSSTELLPGMFVKVAMEVEQQEKLVIPFNAVAFRGEVTGVYVLLGEELQFRYVRLGKRLADNEVVVVSGLSVGERVVTDPVTAAIAIKQQHKRK